MNGKVHTIVVLTDRIDLDDQLYKTFLSAKEFLRYMRIKIKECLKKYGYPPEYREQAIGDVIEQARYMMS